MKALEGYRLNAKVCILDYGSGNVGSVKNSFDRLEIECLISNDITDIRNASHLVLPGVGAFKSSMEKIEKHLPLEELRAQISLNKPLLGICVGMQVFAENGFEFESYPGLNVLNHTEVIELPASVPKPHVGWNSVEIQRKHAIFNDIEDGADFYFVHSYFLSNVEDINIIATSEYGLNFPAVIVKNNVIGVQFHPEKSQNNGDILLRNFVEII